MRELLSSKNPKIYFTCSLIEKKTAPHPTYFSSFEFFPLCAMKQQININFLCGLQIIIVQPLEKLSLRYVRSLHNFIIPCDTLAARLILYVDRRRDRAMASAMVLLQTSRDCHRRGRGRKEFNHPSDAQDGGGCWADKQKTEQVAQEAGSDDRVSAKRPNTELVRFSFLSQLR